MRGAALIETQRLMAQSISALADHIDQSTGYQLTAVTFVQLPAPPVLGMIACISDSTVTTGVIAGGGTNKVLAWFNGAAWKVVAA